MNPREQRRELRSKESTKNKALDLRRNLSPPEVILWRHLKNKQVDGLRFRRQHALGPFIADFYCHEVKLVIEIDSQFHDDLRRDDARDVWMQARGVRVMRFHAREIQTNLHGVLRTIERFARTTRTPSARLADSSGTSPARAGEEAERAADTEPRPNATGGADGARP